MDAVNLAGEQFYDGRKLHAERLGDCRFSARLLTLIQARVRVQAMSACQDVVVVRGAIIGLSEIRRSG